MPNKGYKQTEEHRYNISVSKIGKKFSEEHKLKLSLAKLGKQSSKKGKRYSKLWGNEKYNYDFKKYRKNWLLNRFGTTNLRNTKYGDSIRKSDKIYQVKRRALGLIDKTKEYREWCLKNLNGVNAQQIVNRLIKIGKLKRLPCEICGIKKTHAHHDNYFEPLKIKWLCPSCHKKHHLGIKVANSIKQKINN